MDESFESKEEGDRQKRSEVCIFLTGRKNNGGGRKYEREGGGGKKGTRIKGTIKYLM